MVVVIVVLYVWFFLIFMEGFVFGLWMVFSFFFFGNIDVMIILLIIE